MSRIFALPLFITRYSYAIRLLRNLTTKTNLVPSRVVKLFVFYDDHSFDAAFNSPNLHLKTLGDD